MSEVRSRLDGDEARREGRREVGRGGGEKGREGHKEGNSLKSKESTPTDEKVKCTVSPGDTLNPFPHASEGVP